MSEHPKSCVCKGKGYFIGLDGKTFPCLITPNTMKPIEEEIKSKIQELLPPPGYEKLHEVLQRAMKQAALGKGKERHASGEPFHEQPICVIARWVGIGAQLGQAIKKSRESIRLLNIKGPEAAVFEILGAINWLAAAVIVIEEQSGVSE